MRRRAFITFLGGAASWPLIARAQQTAPSTIGFLNGHSPDSYARVVAAFRKALAENGYVEGRNLSVEYRWAGDHEDRLHALAADLVQRNVAVIVCGGSPTATPAAMAATSTIPIVFATGIDPVEAGYVKSLNRPGGNVTGIAFLASQLSAKRLGLLHELLPNVTTVAALLNPRHPRNAADVKDAEGSARSLGLKLQLLSAGTEDEIAAAFATLDSRTAGALLVGPDPFFLVERHKIVALAAKHAIPAVYELRDFVEDGGLMSYGASIEDAYYQAGVYAARILKGEKPGEFPVMRSTKFELVINLKTAKSLGLTIPPTLLALADEAIE